jgi:formylmethanofuran dehydrogenase subunit E
MSVDATTDRRGEGWSKRELLEDLQKVAGEVGRPPTLEEYGTHGQFPKSRFYKVFESWTVAKKELDMQTGICPNRRIDGGAILEDIQSVAEEMGRPPSSTEYNERAEYSLSSVYKRFDDWADALDAAGLEELNFKSVVQRIGEEELLETLKHDIEEIGHVPTRDEYNEKGTYTDTTYQNYFEGWNSALKKAGFEVNKQLNTRAEVECAACGELMKKPKWKREKRERFFCSRECQFEKKAFEATCSHCGDRTKVTHNSKFIQQQSFCDYKCRYDYYSDNPPNSEPYSCDNCGEDFQLNRWRKEHQSEHHFCTKDCSVEFHKVTKEQIASDYKQIYSKIGRHPGIEDITKYGKHGVDTYYRKFETLHDVASAAGVPKNQQISKEVPCDNCDEQFSKPISRIGESHNFCSRDCYYEWAREGNLREGQSLREPEYGPNWGHQRQKAIERDNHVCQSCGVTSEEHKQRCGMDLHVHHITPWHEFTNHQERNKLSNLITLCSECHATWESLPVKPQVSGDSA